MALLVMVLLSPDALAQACEGFCGVLGPGVQLDPSVPVPPTKGVLIAEENATTVFPVGIIGDVDQPCQTTLTVQHGPGTVPQISQGSGIWSFSATLPEASPPPRLVC